MQIIRQDRHHCRVDRHGHVVKPLAVMSFLQILQTRVSDLFQHNESHGQQTCSDQVANLQRDLLMFSLKFD